MDDILRLLAEKHGMAIGTLIGIPGEPPGKNKPLTCDICGYTDDTKWRTAVHIEKDGLARCKKCSGAWEMEKEQGTLYRRKRKQ